MNKRFYFVFLLTVLVLPLHADTFNIELVEPGVNPVWAISLTPEEGSKETNTVKIYEDVDGMKKVSAAFGKFTDWHFKAMNDKLAPITKMVADINGIRSDAGTVNHLVIIFNHHDDGTDTCTFKIVNVAERTVEWPVYKALITKPWIDSLIEKSTDPAAVAKAKKADDELK